MDSASNGSLRGAAKAVQATRTALNEQEEHKARFAPCISHRSDMQSLQTSLAGLNIIEC